MNLKFTPAERQILKDIQLQNRISMAIILGVIIIALFFIL